MTDIISEYGINDDFFEYVESHINCDTSKLLFSKKGQNLTFDLKFAALQIECRKRIARKVPEITALKHFIFPTSLSTEQCTCQEVAQFHATLFKGAGSILDLTAGLGIDDFYISKEVEQLTSVELSPLLAAALQHNMQRYRSNVTVANDDATNYLHQSIAANRRFDAVFIDPARRGQNDKRIYGLSDCEPDVTQMLDLIKAVTDNLYIKASPMLDLSQLVATIPHITDIHVIGVNNECKELLLHLDFTSAPQGRQVAINTINFENNSANPQVLCLTFRSSQNASVEYADSILQYIYEPNCCIMKSAAFAELSCKYDKLLKLGANTHLFTSDSLYQDFPGRAFKVTDTMSFKSKLIKNLSKRYPQANISTRNFLLPAQALRQRLKIKDGGDTYIFATTLLDKEQILVIAQKI